uniref:acetate--CoA ligase n=1 Tax=Panagrellus redivivus TaxID=6233 RepID=A0A7E4VKI1_PANRE
MDKFVSAPIKVLNALSPSASTKSSDSVQSEPDAPLEYRNLLMDMCGGKSDHVLWIECLKRFDWYGEGKFDFNMDKFGVPVLKNGDYKLNLATECVDRYNKDQPEDHHKIYWEGNYWTPTEDDCVLVSIQTEEILMKKAGNVIKTLGVARGDTVLVVMPFIIQLPIVFMACVRIGAVFSLFDATNTAESIADAINLTQPKLIITTDGFWWGAEKIEVKARVDAALDIVKDKIKATPNVVVIRHGGYDSALPPVSPSKQILGRRPIYDLNVPIDPDRDYKWANLMLGASEHCDPEKMDTEDPMVINLRVRNGEWSSREYSTSQMALLAAVLRQTFGDEPSGAIWPLLDADNLIFVTSLLAIPLSSSSLLLFEGQLDFPNSERLWNVISKYKVEKLILNLTSCQLLMRKELHLANASARSLKVILTVFTSKQESDKAAEWIRVTFPGAKHVAIVY